MPEKVEWCLLVDNGMTRKKLAGVHWLCTREHLPSMLGAVPGPVTAHFRSRLGRETTLEGRSSSVLHDTILYLLQYMSPQSVQRNSHATLLAIRTLYQHFQLPRHRL